MTTISLPWKTMENSHISRAAACTRHPPCLAARVTWRAPDPKTHTLADPPECCQAGLGWDGSNDPLKRCPKSCPQPFPLRMWTRQVTKRAAVWERSSLVHCRVETEMPTLLTNSREQIQTQTLEKKSTTQKGNKQHPPPQASPHSNAHTGGFGV